MTWADYLDLLDWMLPRWSEMIRWDDTERTALFDDLRGYDASDVRRVVESLWAEGRDRPPRGGLIRNRLTAQGILVVPAAPPVCSHTWTHEPPSRAFVGATRGEMRCVRCPAQQECDCEECRSDPLFV